LNGHGIWLEVFRLSMVLSYGVLICPTPTKTAAEAERIGFAATQFRVLLDLGIVIPFRVIDVITY
jgi:hypothetical protein